MATQSLLHVRVSVNKHIGSALIANGYCGKTQIVAGLDPQQKVKLDTTIALAANVEKLNIFDANTEQTLV